LTVEALPPTRCLAGLATAVMMEKASERLRIEEVNEFWFRPGEDEADAGALAYRPAMLIECAVNFRSLRAGLNHSEERSYTAWLPESDMAIDWDAPAAEFNERSQLTIRPDSKIDYRPGNYQTTKADFDQYEAELVDKLVRNERLRLFFNPVFGLFSAPGDELEEFLARVAEASLGRVEPELKSLRNRFELQLEQVREAQAAKGLRAEKFSLEKFISHKQHLFKSENRLADMFSTLAGAVFGATEPRAQDESYEWEETELREDLDRVEQEASEALRALYGEYLTLANEYDVFEIGLQPDNIQVTRRVLLWVPTSEGR
jgi:hypothetical protein